MFNVPQATFDIDVSRPPPSFSNEQCSPPKDVLSSVMTGQQQNRKGKKDSKDYGGHVFEGKPIETIGTVKPVAGAPFIQHPYQSLSNMSDNKVLEEGGLSATLKTQ